MTTLTWHDVDDVAHPLTEANGIRVQRGVSGLDGPPMDNSVAAIGAGDGGVLLNARRSVRQIVLPVMVDGVSKARTVINAFQGPGRLVATTDVGNRELRHVVYEAGLEGVWSAESGGIEGGTAWRKFPVVLLALDPMWYGDTVAASFGPPEGDQTYDAALPYDEAATYDGAASGLTGAAATYDAALPYDEAEPYDGGALFTATWASYLGSWVTLTFHGPATQAKVLHLRTGEVVELKAGQTLGAGQDLVVTTDPRNRDITVGGQPAWDRVTAESTASMMLLPGDQLALIMSGTSLDSLLSVTYEERWLTPYESGIDAPVEDDEILDGGEI